MYFIFILKSYKVYFNDLHNVFYLIHNVGVKDQAWFFKCVTISLNHPVKVFLLNFRKQLVMEKLPHAQPLCQWLMVQNASTVENVVVGNVFRFVRLKIYRCVWSSLTTPKRKILPVSRFRFKSIVFKWKETIMNWFSSSSKGIVIFIVHSLRAIAFKFNKSYRLRMRFSI